MGVPPLIVGIAGGSGSGKTHLAHSVALDLGPANCAVLSMDQYFRSPSTGLDVRDINFDHPAHLDFTLMVQHLEELKTGKVIVAPSYDFRTMIQKPGAVEVVPRPVILVEGLFVLAKPMVDLVDISVFLDVAADQRLLGRILRDARERDATSESLVDRYQRFVRPSYEVFVAPTKQNADIVVDFTYRRILLTQMLTLLLRSLVGNSINRESFKRNLRAECYHLGFTPRDGEMPVSIDILKLAKDYPESESSQPSVR
jgi:uridine kinase